MYINDTENYNGMQRTALIYSNEQENSNKYYILELEQNEEGKFVVTFKYGRRGKNPKVLKDINNNYRLACKTYNNKISFLKNKKKYKEVEFLDIMANDSSAFFNFKELEIIR